MAEKEKKKKSSKSKDPSKKKSASRDPSKKKKKLDDADLLPALISEDEGTALEKARRNGRIRGWLEGGGSVVGVLVILSFWKIFAVLAGVGAVGYGGYWYIKRKKANAEPTE